jgi:hypothetical protein
MAISKNAGEKGISVLYDGKSSNDCGQKDRLESE